MWHLLYPPLKILLALFVVVREGDHVVVAAACTDDNWTAAVRIVKVEVAHEREASPRWDSVLGLTMLFLLLLLRRLVPERVSEGFRELLHAEWVDQLQSPPNIISFSYDQFCFKKALCFICKKNLWMKCAVKI